MRRLLDPERQFLFQPMHVGVSDLAQQVVQLRGHPVMAVADPRADVPQIDQEAERLAVALSVIGHVWALT